MNIRNRLTYALSITSATLISSLYLPIIPCKTLSTIPGRSLSWGICNFNPDTYASNLSSQKFFGYTTSLTDATTILIVVTFILIFFASKYINFGKL